MHRQTLMIQGQKTRSNNVYSTQLIRHCVLYNHTYYSCVFEMFFRLYSKAISVNFSRFTIVSLC